MKAKVVYNLKKDTREGGTYYKNALLVDTRFGTELAVASSNKNFSDIIGTDTKIDVFWYKDHYCISE